MSEKDKILIEVLKKENEILKLRLDAAVHQLRTYELMKTIGQCELEYDKLTSNLGSEE